MGEKKMSNLFKTNSKIRGNKKSPVIAILFIALLASSIAAVIPIASAHLPAYTIPTWSYLNAFPNPVGVNQRMSMFGWLDKVPPTANGAYGDRWTGMTIDVTLPDGSKATLGPFVSDPVGTIFTTYVPNQVGTYQFQLKFAGETLTGSQGNPLGPFLDFSPTSLSSNAYINDTFTASESTVMSVSVQSSPIAPEPEYAQPTEYWTIPVSQPGHASTWGSIMGDYLGFGGGVNPYTSPPLSAHIAWTKPINIGGVAGMPDQLVNGNNGYYSYLSYEGMFSPPILMNGMLYYNVANPPEYGFVCVDMHTGKQVWYQNGTQDPLASLQVGMGFLKQNYPQLTYGQHLDYESPNQHGIMDYLWCTYTMANGSTVWSLYDPFTGNWICDLVHAGGGGGGFSFGASNMMPDAIGSFVTYSPSADFKTMSVWNSTKTLQDTYPSNNVVMAANGYWMWRPPLGGIIDATNGITNVKITGNIPANFQAVSVGPFGPSNALGLTLLGIDKASQLAIYVNSTATLGEGTWPPPAGIAVLGISIAPNSLGQVRFAKEIPYPANGITLNTGYVGSGVFTLFQKETALWMGFSQTTGDLIWTTSTPEVANHIYGVTGAIDKGVLYSGDSIGEGGIIYAYDVTNGNLLWKSTPETLGNAGYWADIPKSVSNIAGGVIFWQGSEHSPSAVLEPGFKIGTMSTQTGQKLWDITFWSAGGGFGGGFAIADGYAIALNAYDCQIYAFSKGPTATTAQTPLAAISKGQSLIVQGSVTDISPGTAESDIALRFPNGVPAVSDASQTAWMEYVYMQNPKPSSSGVPVSIVVKDPSGNYKTATATTDNTGTYSLQITPDMTSVVGKYTVIATFAGSNSYWGSNAESTFVVDGAGATAATQQNNVDTYFLPAVIAIIVVVIIIGVLIMMMLRKRD
jgi:hypothetical protein